MNILWLCGVALVACLVSAAIRRWLPEWSSMLPLCAVVVLLAAFVPLLSDITSAAEELAAEGGLPDGSTALVLKAVGIGLVSRLASSFCLDCGQKALSETVDFCGQTVILSMAVPLILDLADQILNFGPGS